MNVFFFLQYSFLPQKPSIILDPYQTECWWQWIFCQGSKFFLLFRFSTTSWKKIETVKVFCKHSLKDVRSLGLLSNVVCLWHRGFMMNLKCQSLPCGNFFFLFAVISKEQFTLWKKLINISHIHCINFYN